MTEYVAGFLFNDDGSQVALVTKRRPAWQEGKLNAIGGHIEEGETATDAMAREFEEEAGVYSSDWIAFCFLTGSNNGGWKVWFFYQRSSTLLADVKQTGDEKIEVYQTAGLGRSALTIPNLTWLIPMALDFEHQNVGIFHVIEA